MAKKILFSDMDGTLLDSAKGISPALHTLIADTVNNGARLVLSSGRALSSIVASAARNDLLFSNTIIIAANGNLIYDYSSQKILQQKSVPLSIARQIVQYAQDLDLHIQSYDDTHFICKKAGPEAQFYTKGTGMDFKLRDDILDQLPHDPVKLLAIDLNSRDKLYQLRDKVLDHFGDTLTSMFSCNEYLEIFDKTAGKGNAVRFVCDYLQIPIEDSVAAGDQENDISMLEAAGAAVAMANARQSVKECADFITQKDNDHDGLAEAIQYYFYDIR